MKTRIALCLVTLVIGLVIGYIAGFNVKPSVPTGKLSNSELTDFILADKTDTIKFDKDTFDCMSFASTLRDNAIKQGIKCAIVSMYMNVFGFHAINRFDTDDMGTVFIEPQMDLPLEDIYVGGNYLKSKLKAYYKYTGINYVDKGNVDDYVIIRIVTIW